MVQCLENDLTHFLQIYECDPCFKPYVFESKHNKFYIKITLLKPNKNKYKITIKPIKNLFHIDFCN